MKIYKPYSYLFFIKNYSNCYESMWKNYVNHKRDEYDWFVILTSETYYINSSFEEIINWLEDKEDKIVTIENLNWNPKQQYQMPQFYYRYNVEEYKTIIAEYKDKYGTLLKRVDVYNNTVHWKQWQNNLKGYLKSYNILEIYYSSEGCLYYVQYDNKNKKWETTITTLNNQYKRDINRNDIEQIEKILAKMSKCGDFYKDDIEEVCNLLGISL